MCYLITNDIGTCARVYVSSMERRYDAGAHRNQKTTGIVRSRLRCVQCSIDFLPSLTLFLRVCMTMSVLLVVEVHSASYRPD